MIAHTKHDTTVNVCYLEEGENGWDKFTEFARSYYPDKEISDIIEIKTDED